MIFLWVTWSVMIGKIVFKQERCSSDGLLIFYGPVNVVELDRELRNSVILHCFHGRPSGWSDIWYSMKQITKRHNIYRAPAAQRQMRQMRKKISFGPTFFHLAQTFGAYFFRRHFYFFLCYKRYELRKWLMTPNKQCRWRVFLNWWWPLVIIGYKVRPIIDTYLVDWTWCLFN